MAQNPPGSFQLAGVGAQATVYPLLMSFETGHWNKLLMTRYSTRCPGAPLPTAFSNNFAALRKLLAAGVDEMIGPEAEANKTKSFRGFFFHKAVHFIDALQCVVLVPSGSRYR